MKKKKKNPKIKDVIKVINSLKEEKDIKFVFSFIKIGDTLDEFNSEEHEIFNCAEDRNDEQGNISNSKLKSLGFIFDEYD